MGWAKRAPEVTLSERCWLARFSLGQEHRAHLSSRFGGGARSKVISGALEKQVETGKAEGESSSQEPGYWVPEC